MKHVLIGAALATASILASVSPAGAATQQTTDTYCVRVTHGTFATPIGLGGINTPVADALHMTGTMTCTDANGAPLVTGTVEQTVTIPQGECTGQEIGNTSKTVVTWSDGTVSNFTFDHSDVIKANGAAGLVVSGSVSGDSTRFAGDTVSGAGTGTSVGCGTAAGEAAADSTLVLYLAHA